MIIESKIKTKLEQLERTKREFWNITPEVGSMLEMLSEQDVTEMFWKSALLTDILQFG